MPSPFAHPTSARLRSWWGVLVWVALQLGLDPGQSQAGWGRDGLSVSEYEGATLAAVRADAAVPTVSYVRGPDLGGGVGGLVASLRYSGAGQAPLVRYNLSNGRETGSGCNTLTKPLASLKRKDGARHSQQVGAVVWGPLQGGRG